MTGAGDEVAAPLATAPYPDAWLIPRESEGSERPVIAAIGGDGVGPEIVRAAVACLRASGAPIEIAWPLADAPPLVQNAPLPDPVRAAIDSADAILFGAADSGPAGRHVSVLRYLRWGLDTYANLRPAVRLPNIGQTRLAADDASGGVNLVIVRELSEGLYPGREGSLADLHARWPELRDALGRPLPATGVFAVRVVTEPATRRIARYAARLAARRKALGRGPGHVTIVGKANVLRQTDGLFTALCEEEIGRVDGVACSALYVDEAARRLVACPESFDVIVTSNLFGDILSDVAAEWMGGMPMAPSAAIGDRLAYFESCHGSAPDIAGQDVANPAATILSGAMLLAYLGLSDHARRVTDATLDAIRGGCKTRDLGGDATTSEFADRVCRALGG